MPVIDERAIVLAEVPMLENDAPIGTNIFIENQKKIQRYNLKTNILDKISALKFLIGNKSDSLNDIKANGIFLDIENTNARIDEIDDNIGIPSGKGNAEGATGIYSRIEQLELDRDNINKKNLIEGYKIRFGTNDMNLLSDNSYTYNFVDIKENIEQCLNNKQDYDINLHLNIVYEIKNTTYGKLSTKAIINLNSVYNTGTDKKGIVYIPIVNANLILKFTVKKNEITFLTTNKINVDDIKSDNLTVTHAVLEFNKLKRTE